MTSFFEKLIDSKNTDVAAHIVIPVISSLSMLLMSAYHLFILHNPFDASNLGQGIGWLLGGGGLAAAGQAVQQNKGGDNPDADSK